MLLASRISRFIHVCITCSNEGFTGITCTCKYLSSCVGPFFILSSRNAILEFDDHEGSRTIRAGGMSSDL